MGTTEQSTRGKWIRLFGLAALGVILIIGALSSFPVIEYRGNRIRMFAPDRLLGKMPSTIRGITRPQENVRGWVLGEHVLETEYGQIVLKNRPHISAIRNTVGVINVDNFRQGRASHNLVVEGIEIPPYVSIIFRDFRVAFRPRISTLLLHDRHEINISGVPLNITEIDINSPRYIADMIITFFGGEYISLTDSTQIRGRYLRGLYMYADDGLWRIRSGQISIRLPGEARFTEYRSVTFERDWGAFVEGVPR